MHSNNSFQSFNLCKKYYLTSWEISNYPSSKAVARCVLLQRMKKASFKDRSRSRTVLGLSGNNIKGCRAFSLEGSYKMEKQLTA